jgi:carboxyl-terminal processing protease
MKQQSIQYLLVFVFLLIPNLSSAQMPKTEPEDKPGTSGSLVSAAPMDIDGDLQCRYIPKVEETYFQAHVRYSKIDDKIKNQVVDQYIKRLDPSKIFFTSEDVGQISKKILDTLNKPKDRDCQFLREIQRVLIARTKERVQYVTQVLGPKYKFDKTAEIDMDMDKREAPKSPADAEKFLKTYIHFQISNYLATDIKLPEAKKNVIKNWNRTLKRTAEIESDELYANYLDAYARALDPHSSFFGKEYFEDFKIGMGLALEGIGATLSSQDGITVVEALVPGGAAAKSGLIEPQDKIVSVGQGPKGKLENVIDMELREVVKRIRGPKDSNVRLVILRQKAGKKERYEIVLKREKINLEDEAAQVTYLDKEVGGVKKTIAVVNLPSFYADSRRSGRSSAKDMKKIMKEVASKKVSGMVLDLASNSGGSLEDAVKIAGLFFKTGNVVKQSTREDLPMGGETSLADKDSEIDFNGPLVVLTSRLSASASEIVAGTLQDYKRAVVVGGDHTFGKGSIQQVIPFLNDSSALKITIGMFFTPGGNSTQHRGVVADIPLPGAFDLDDLGEKSLDYSLPPKKIDPFISDSAFVVSGEGAWKKIAPEQITVLKEKSTKRVAQSEDFKKIVDELNKTKARGKVIKLAEITAESKKKEKEKSKGLKNLSKQDKEKEYLKRADVQEAVSVLSDLMSI